jgi:zinc transporter 9
MALLKLIGLCLAMFFGAYLCGEIPLRCPISQKRMKYLTTLGVGLLIGVSFIVIIPEGVHTYYGAKAPAHAAAGLHGGHNATSFAKEITAVANAHTHSNKAAQSPVGHEHAHIADHAGEDAAEHNHAGASEHVDLDASGEHDEHEEGHDHSGHDHVHQECVDLNRSSSSVGLALVSGFVVMFLVDRLGGAEEGHAHGAAHAIDSPHSPGDRHGHHGSGVPTQHIHVHPTAGGGPGGNHEHPRSGSASPNSLSSGSLSQSGSVGSLSQLRIEPPQGAIEEVAPLRQFSAARWSAIPHVAIYRCWFSIRSCFTPFLAAPHFDQTATVGILVHSAIDGLALGAISVSDNSSLELVVFFAIILHKAPAAFGLTSFLMHQGRTHSEVRKHLLYFSLAAPLTSLATFISFGYYNALAGSNSLSASSPDGQALLGLCLLFSAGTFLFTIAVHILPEIQQDGKQAAEWPMVVCLISGILAPLGFSGHSHGH